MLVENLNGMRQVLYSRKRLYPCATAGSRTRVNGLGSRHDNRYTTVAHAPVMVKFGYLILHYLTVVSFLIFGPAQDLILHTEG